MHQSNWFRNDLNKLVWTFKIDRFIKEWTLMHWCCLKIILHHKLLIKVKAFQNESQLIRKQIVSLYNSLTKWTCLCVVPFKCLFKLKLNPFFMFLFNNLLNFLIRDFHVKNLAVRWNFHHRLWLDLRSWEKDEFTIWVKFKVKCGMMELKTMG